MLLFVKIFQISECVLVHIRNENETFHKSLDVVWLLFKNREVVSKFLVPNRKLQVCLEKSCENVQRWVT